MKRYRLIYLRCAQKDLLEIIDYIKADNPAAVHRLLDRFNHTLQRLTQFPWSGTLPRDESLRAKGYRVVVIGDYLAFYLVKGKTIQIRRVIQGRRLYSFLV